MNYIVCAKLASTVNLDVFLNDIQLISNNNEILVIDSIVAKIDDIILIKNQSDQKTKWIVYSNM